MYLVLTNYQEGETDISGINKIHGRVIMNRAYSLLITTSDITKPLATAKRKALPLWNIAYGLLTTKARSSTPDTPKPLSTTKHKATPYKILLNFCW